MAGPILGNSRGQNYRRPPMGEINVTPFVDVMLVLLVVFMITAPLITQGVQISLPQVENTQINEVKEPIQVTLKRGGQVFIQDLEIEQADLIERLKAIRSQKETGTSILVRADKDVSYGEVMRIMSAIQIAGLVDVGLVTEPPAN